MGILQIIVVIMLMLFMIKPLGTYIYHVFSNEPNKTDKIFNPIEKIIYKICGMKNRLSMTWKQYAGSLLLTNMVFIAVGYVILRFQYILPLNPNGIENMNSMLSFNTIISFMTNTNLQHYSGETGLSYFSQMAVIMMMMFTSAATGIAAAIAFIRGITSKGKTIGNFFEDFVKGHTRLLIPMSIILTIILVSLKVPQTLSPSIEVTTLEGVKQVISIGPVASLESIKHLGTNGGGFFGANSAHPFENPSPLTNVIEILSMWCIPASLTYTYGRFAKKQKQGWVIFGAMFILFIAFLSLIYVSESHGNPALTALGLDPSQGSMEGKEVRFGIAQSALFSSVTTAATTGTVNNMHDTLTPLGQITPLSLMMLNTVFGGDGVGLVNMLMYAIIGVFICGLMVGRTPEFLGRKIEPKEMKLITVALLAHPLIILAPTALAFLADIGKGSISNPGFHGVSQVLYEFASSAANNGSGFEGLADNTPFWNISTGLVMLVGRYISIIALLAVAGSLVQKQPVPETIGTFKTDNLLFIGILVGVVLIVGALTFFPVIALGPIAEYLSIR
ncbi:MULTISPECIES: potassium-transporting ATPase subunit KdpA [Bacillus]|uniref:potassium-transporting ATPase subunit KdpA n=1 Tax=Bacillus TaxID=1386 RepID=UPI00061DB931|nr:MULTISPECIES: potassium-transporting ATPase subunit KdpA [Bacillus]AKE23813.1 K+-transporting ATPase, A subunit [Bacillus sp. LM 4-2]MDI6563177.1 potassium-transporting ATPase subunit KdpA [Bacillus subtilis]QAR92946.1 potassium-transporting ATPase subunit A [Bacillus subtilis]QAT36558.1 potassium-transporting ATPase subunit A [Bacillus subtilis]QHH20350.1 potassium-transporting ATPase subunit A [Bacillus subtilis]